MQNNFANVHIFFQIAQLFYVFFIIKPNTMLNILIILLLIEVIELLFDKILPIQKNKNHLIFNIKP